MAKKKGVSRRSFLGTSVAAAGAAAGAGLSKTAAAEDKKAESHTSRSGEQLKYFPVTHGGIRQTHHPRLGAEINGQTCIRYLRFMRPVKIDRLELGLITGAETSPMGGSGRWGHRECRPIPPT